MEPDEYEHEVEVKSQIPEMLALTGTPASTQQIVLTAKTFEEAEAQIALYEQIHTMQLDFLRTKEELTSKRKQLDHDIESSKAANKHDHKMELLKFVVPVFSGLVFAVLGLILIFHPNPITQYIGISLLFIGACALIPGISKVLVSISQMTKSLHAISQEVKKTAASSNQTEEE
jgi:lipopolysaccharide export LptBFGC system permease protein LptF